jgi:hypothetical protein
MRYRGAGGSRWPLMVLVAVVIVAIVAVAYYINVIPH